MSSLRITRWDDPVVDRLGADVMAGHVETFWLPVLGPSATLLLRRCAILTDRHPDGVTVDDDDLARCLGLGGTGGRHAPFPRAIARLARFGMARRPAADAVAFRRRVGPLPLRLGARLPDSLKEAYERDLAAFRAVAEGRPA